MSTDAATADDAMYHAIAIVVSNMNVCSGIRSSGFSRFHASHVRKKSAPAIHDPTMNTASPA